jgi:hypothetical protein
MAGESFEVFSPAFNDRIERAVHRVERNLDATTRPRRGAIAGSGGGCESQDTIWDFSIFGSPTMGFITVPFSANGVLKPVRFEWNYDRFQFKQAILDAHSEIEDGDMIVSAGPFPDATMRLEWTGKYKNKLMPIPTASWASLTGGNGRGVFIQMPQRGHS